VRKRQRNTTRSKGQANCPLDQSTRLTDYYPAQGERGTHNPVTRILRLRFIHQFFGSPSAIVLLVFWSFLVLVVNSFTDLHAAT
jgi:hypothetical protein